MLTVKDVNQVLNSKFNTQVIMSKIFRKDNADLKNVGCYSLWEVIYDHG